VRQYHSAITSGLGPPGRCGSRLPVGFGVGHREHELLARLASVKHYFLLDKGDLFIQFMNVAQHELLQDVKCVLAVMMMMMMIMMLMLMRRLRLMMTERPPCHFVCKGALGS
jgi:hypothetical protein